MDQFPIHPNSTLPSSSLYVYNKVDGISLDFLNEIAHEPYTTVMSCELDLGVQDVVDRIWKELRLIRIYTKRYVLLRAVMIHSQKLAKATN